MMSHGRRCPHCLRELEPEGGDVGRGETAVAPEADDGVSGLGQAVRGWVRQKLVPPSRTKATPRRRRKAGRR